MIGAMHDLQNASWYRSETCSFWSLFTYHPTFLLLVRAIKQIYLALILLVEFCVLLSAAKHHVTVMFWARAFALPRRSEIQRGFWDIPGYRCVTSKIKCFQLLAKGIDQELVVSCFQPRSRPPNSTICASTKYNFRQSVWLVIAR